MKKLAIVLGSLVALSTIVAAKEVIVEPVVVVEPVIVEKIVYRDAIPAWRPTGEMDLSYKYYGRDEYDSMEYGRLQFQGHLQMTPNQKLEYRVRNYNSLNSPDTVATGDMVGDYGNSADLRFRYFYNHGNLGGSKVNLTSRIHYRNRDSDTGSLSNGNRPNGIMGRSQEVEYQARFNFVEYMAWTPTWFKNTDMTLAPKYKYAWGGNDSNYTNTLGIDLYSKFDLGYGFSTELNIYSGWRDHGSKSDAGNFDEYVVDIEAYLYYTKKLWESGALALNFNFEGGLDPYSTGERASRKAGIDTAAISSADWFAGRSSSYELYAAPSFELTYQATEHLKTYMSVGAEYKNWRVTSASNAQNWSWMPQATVGFKVDFK